MEMFFNLQSSLLLAAPALPTEPHANPQAQHIRRERSLALGSQHAGGAVRKGTPGIEGNPAKACCNARAAAPGAAARTARQV